MFLKIEEINYIENIINNINKNYNYNKLCEILNQFDNNLYNLYSIYYWITHNIIYNVNSFINLLKDNKIIEKSICTPEYVYNNKCAVCSGYVNLFLDIFSHRKQINDIEIYEIIGITNSTFDNDNNIKEIQHKWIGIKYNNKYYICDPTWGSGYVDPNNLLFISNYSYDQFLIEPEIAINNHFPNKKEYQFLLNPITKEQFLKQPFIYPDTLYINLKLLSHPLNYYEINTNYFEEIISFNKNVKINCYLYEKSKLLPIYCYTIKYDIDDENDYIKGIIQLFFPNISNYVLYIYGDKKLILQKHIKVLKIEKNLSPILIISKEAQYSKINLISPSISYIYNIDSKGIISLEYKYDNISYIFMNDENKITYNSCIGLTKIKNKEKTIYYFFYICKNIGNNLLHIYFNQIHYLSFNIYNEVNNNDIDFNFIPNHIIKKCNILNKPININILNKLFSDNIIENEYILWYENENICQVNINVINIKNCVISTENISKSNIKGIKLIFPFNGYFNINIYMNNELVYEEIHFYVISKIKQNNCCIIF